MTDDFIPHGCYAQQDSGRRGWIGCYSAPNIGIEYVRDGAGLIRLHRTEQAARDAAVDARDAVLNRMEKEKLAHRSLGRRVFSPMGSGRSRFFKEAKG